MVRKKGFYSISAVAKMFSIHQQTIRLYEKEGLINPKRSEGNTRLFSDEDIDKLEEIIYLTHQLGVNLAGVQMILKLESKISKMQKKMNALFDKTSEELKHEKELAKSSISSSVRSLMQLKSETNRDNYYDQEDVFLNRKKQTSKSEPIESQIVGKDLEPNEAKNIKPGQNSSQKRKNQGKDLEAEMDSWEIEYDD